MNKATKIFVTSILLISLLINSIYAAYWGVDESGQYGFDKILLVLNTTYSQEPEAAAEHIKQNYPVDNVKISTEQEDVSEESPYVMLILYLPEMEEAEFLQIFENLSEEEYTLTVSKDYYTGPCNAYLGDVTQDGKFTTEDARLVLQYASDIAEVKTETQKYLADANQDGAITIQDAVYVLKLCCKIETNQ